MQASPSIIKIGSTEADGDTFAQSLGRLLLITQVRINPNISTYLCSPDMIPLHTDHPDANIIVWHCHAQDESGGENILSDGWAAYQLLSLKSQRALCTVTLGCPSLTGLQIKSRRSLIDAKNEKIFFAPWLLSDDLSCSQTSSVQDFQEIINTEPSVRMKVRLDTGEALVINNNRFLHGRERINLDSKRWLTRYWITHEV